MFIRTTARRLQVFNIEVWSGKRVTENRPSWMKYRCEEGLLAGGAEERKKFWRKQEEFLRRMEELEDSR